MKRGAAGLAFLIFLCSCTSPAGVSQFAETAEKSIALSPPIFDDIHDSCIRRHSEAALISASFLSTHPRAAPEPASCVPFGTQAEGLIQASEVLNAYFRAMRQLAEFNTSTASTVSEQGALAGAAAAKLNGAQADSVGKLAGLVTQLLTARYQRTKLLDFLRQADPAVASVTQAFEGIVAQDYAGLLHEEEQTLRVRYQEAGGDSASQATLLLLNRAYTEDLHELNRKRTEAAAYVSALQQIREGHHQLALNIGRMKTKEIDLAIEPYTTRLNGLVPALQKSL